MIQPFKRPAGVDQDAGRWYSARRALFGWEGRLNTEAHTLDYVDILTHMAARGDGTDERPRDCDIDVIVDDDNEFAAVGAGARAGSDEQSLLVARVAR